MTIAEKIKMYKEKEAFVYGLAMAFIKVPKGHTVENIIYEVYQKEINGNTCFYEWIIVHFRGGAIAPITVNGNSNLANYRAIGNLIDGGYYNEVPYYLKMEEAGYERVGF